jgi:pantetheine-phosphate adenylyltransferase
MILIFPGSFDPVTAGHIDIARRAAKLSERLIIAVLENASKQTLFSLKERTSFLEEALDSANIEIESFDGLMVEFAKIKNASAVVRGLRSSADFENENCCAAANNALYAAFYQKNIETVFIPASPALAFVSSSVIKEAASHIYKKNLNDSFIAEHVPPLARAALRNKFSYPL